MLWTLLTAAGGGRVEVQHVIRPQSPAYDKTSQKIESTQQPGYLSTVQRGDTYFWVELEAYFLRTRGTQNHPTHRELPQNHCSMDKCYLVFRRSPKTILLFTHLLLRPQVRQEALPLSGCHKPALAKVKALPSLRQPHIERSHKIFRSVASRL